jgi:hypothetical protein
MHKRSIYQNGKALDLITLVFLFPGIGADTEKANPATATQQ